MNQTLTIIINFLKSWYAEFSVASFEKKKQLISALFIITIMLSPAFFASLLAPFKKFLI